MRSEAALCELYQIARVKPDPWEKTPNLRIDIPLIATLAMFFTLRAVEALSLEGRMRQGKSYTAISRNHQSLGPPTTPCNCMAGCQASSSEA